LLNLTFCEPITYSLSSTKIGFASTSEIIHLGTLIAGTNNRTIDIVKNKNVQLTFKTPDIAAYTDKGVVQVRILSNEGVVPAGQYCGSGTFTGFSNPSCTSGVNSTKYYLTFGSQFVATDPSKFSANVTIDVMVPQQLVYDSPVLRKLDPLPYYLYYPTTTTNYYQHYYYFTKNTDDLSLTLVARVIDGNSITVEITDCNNIFHRLDCSDNDEECVFEFSRTNTLDFGTADRNDIRVVVKGENSYYSLTLRKGLSNCRSDISPSSADFCGTLDISFLNKRSTWAYGSVNGKDNYALKRYNDLVKRFSYCRKGNCAYQEKLTCELSDKCKNSLKKFACQEAFPECSVNGIKQDICSQSCYEVVQNCEKTFSEVALPKFECKAAIFRDCNPSEGTLIGVSLLLFIALFMLV